MRKLKQNNQVMILKGDCLSIMANLELGGAGFWGTVPSVPPCSQQSCCHHCWGTWLCLPQTGPGWVLSGEQRILNLGIVWWGENAEEEERWRERGGFGICQKWLLVCFALWGETMGGVGLGSLSSPRKLQLDLKHKWVVVKCKIYAAKSLTLPLWSKRL